MTDQTQLCFRALADPTRRDIVRLLATRDMTISQLTDQFDMTRAAVKKHLIMLSDGGLIKVHAKGRERFNSLNPAGMNPARNWLEYFDAFWDDRLATLKSAIEKDEK